MGLTPKTYLRVRRFQAAMRMLDAGGVRGARIAADLGYFDQAHFVREFRSFTAMTPTQYTERRTWLPSHVGVHPGEACAVTDARPARVPGGGVANPGAVHLGGQWGGRFAGPEQGGRDRAPTPVRSGVEHERELDRHGAAPSMPSTASERQRIRSGASGARQLGMVTGASGRSPAYGTTRHRGSTSAAHPSRHDGKRAR